MSNSTSNTTPMASGNISPADFDKTTPTADRAKADSSTRDRGSKSLVKNMPVGAQKPANGKAR